eukprot:gene2586-1318_t
MITFIHTPCTSVGEANDCKWDGDNCGVNAAAGKETDAPTKAGGDDGSTTWWILILILLLLSCSAMLAMLLLKKKGKEEDEKYKSIATDAELGEMAGRDPSEPGQTMQVEKQVMRGVSQDRDWMTDPPGEWDFKK